MPQYSLHHYHVSFAPEIEGKRIRKALLLQHAEKYFGHLHLFDGMMLFLPQKLPDVSYLFFNYEILIFFFIIVLMSTSLCLRYGSIRSLLWLSVLTLATPYVFMEGDISLWPTRPVSAEY